MPAHSPGLSILRGLLGQRRYAWLMLALLALGFLADHFGLLSSGSVLPKDESSIESLTVSRVIDGDTFELSNGEKVRLIGIDTPESVKPNTPVECFAKEASAFLKEKIEGKELRLERDVSDRDRYGRLLRYAYLDDGQSVNELLVREGYATASSFPPDIRNQHAFRQAEQGAREAKRGLWDPAICPAK